MVGTAEHQLDTRTGELVVGEARGFRGAGECGSESWKKVWRIEEVGPLSYGHVTGNGLKRSMISTEMGFLVGTGK